ncbi:MAG TPA: DnaD domain-containing protein [Bacilli bacterium]|nr:DnaD domain-containing protein [Bacilli bacterium]
MAGKARQDDAFTVLMTSGFFAVPGVLMKHYKQLGLADEEMMLLLHLLHFRQEGIAQPTAEQLSERMLMPADMIGNSLFNLIRLGFLEIEEHGATANSDGRMYEEYSLRPLYHKLQELLTPQRPSATPSSFDLLNRKEQMKNVFSLFEQEFGRPLSPLEYEHITRWLDEDRYKEEIIREALREAVLSAKFNFKYIDRILFEWQKNNIRTLQELTVYREQYRNRASGSRGGAVAKTSGGSGSKGKGNKPSQDAVHTPQENKYDAFYKMYGDN